MQREQRNQDYIQHCFSLTAHQWQKQCMAPVELAAVKKAAKARKAGDGCRFQHLGIIA